MGESNRIIHGLWIGASLSELEMLTIKSFIFHGHEFHLWLYDSIDLTGFSAIGGSASGKKNLSGLFVEDANAIIPRESIFHYPVTGKINWGKGSYAGFSDIFRYKLLYEKGGWWVDMDMTCLKPFDFEEEYFFRDHWKYKIVGNAMKCPAGAPLLQKCYEQTVKEVTSENISWHKPIEILNKNIADLGLLHFRQKGLFNDDHSYKLKKYFTGNSPIPGKWYGIHWVNSAGKIDYKPGSTFAKLLEYYDVK